MKFKSCSITGSVVSLLIEPKGIEIDREAGNIIEKGLLLIEPKGIEIQLICLLQIQFHLLIEPKGIEISL